MGILNWLKNIENWFVKKQLRATYLNLKETVNEFKKNIESAPKWLKSFKKEVNLFLDGKMPFIQFRSILRNRERFFRVDYAKMVKSIEKCAEMRGVDKPEMVAEAAELNADKELNREFKQVRRFLQLTQPFIEKMQEIILSMQVVIEDEAKIQQLKRLLELYSHQVENFEVVKRKFRW